MSQNTNIGFVLWGILLLVSLFGVGMWVGVWIDDEKYTPDSNDHPNSPELERLMQIGRVMQKMQNSIAANHGLIVSQPGTIISGEESQSFDEGFNQGFS